MANNRGSVISKIIIILCLAVFIVCGAMVGKYVFQTLGASNDLKDLKAVVEESEDDGLVKLHDQNSDLVGWITVEDTNIDYPVMQTPDDPQYYLHIDFEKKWSNSGTPFMDAESDPTSSNWLIYGHNMQMGTMFHDLLKYDDDQFWEDHDRFQYTRLYEDQETGELKQAKESYEVIAAGYSEIYGKNSTEFKYYEYPYIADRNTFDEYVQGVKADSYHQKDSEVEFGDQLVTLSTCAYQTDDGRFYIVGRRINNDPKKLKTE